jgi:hypothetical protein
MRGAAFAAAVVVAAAAASGALADAGAPSDTTPTPTVTTPDAAPPVPRPDPGPVQVAPKPRVVHHTTPPAVVVQQPVYQAPAAPAVVVQPSTPVKPKTTKPRAKPKQVAAKRKRPVQSKHVSPKLVAKAKPVATLLPLPKTPAQSSSGGWLNTAVVAGLLAFFLSAGLVATRRALRATPPVAIAASASSNGSGPAVHVDTVLAAEPLEHLPVLSPIRTPAAEKQCAIAWWRGYVRSQFLASETNAAGHTVVAESPPFAWRSRTPPPETDEAVAAHRQLMATLSDLGWEAVHFGPAWFEVEFQRAPVTAGST